MKTFWYTNEGMKEHECGAYVLREEALKEISLLKERIKTIEIELQRIIDEGYCDGCDAEYVARKLMGLDP